MAEKPTAYVGAATFGDCYALEHLLLFGAPLPTGGKIVSSKTYTTFVDGELVATVGSDVQSDCGHFGTVLIGSSNTFADGAQVARMGDSFSGDYMGTIKEGSFVTFTED